MISQSLELFLYICGGIITLSGAVTVVIRVFKQAVIKAAESSLQEHIREVDEELTNRIEHCQREIHDEIREINETLNKFINKSIEIDELHSSTLMSLARDRINEAYNYYIDKPSISSHSLAVLEELYACYSKLGGNNFTGEQMKRLREKPITKD